MSNYNGRRGPNVSQFIAELNTIPTTQEMAATNTALTMADDDFSLFTNAEFFDFDIPDMPDLAQQSVDYDPVHEERSRRQNASAFRFNASKSTEPIADNFSFPVYPTFPSVVDQPATANFQQQQQQPAPHYQYTPQTSPTAASPNDAHALPGASGNMHSLDSIRDQSNQSVEEAVRHAAEEDKRRRNTAASARFRIKKKQREQALEKTAKEMSDKVHVLESKVSQLEMENKWLKSLITEKNETKTDIADLYKKFTEKTNSERSTGERNDGVGTKGVRV